MKTSFLLDKNTIFRNRGKIRRQWSSFILVVVALILYVIGPNVANWFSGAGLVLAAPFVNQSRNVVLGFSDALEASFKNNLVLENHALLAQLNDARSQALAQSNMAEELDQLRRLFGRGATTTKQIQVSLAKVISRPPYQPNDVVLIDLGSNQSSLIKVSDLVYAYDNLRLGEVVAVYTNESKVELYSSPQISLPVLVGGTSTPTTAYGLGDGNFMLKVPKGLDLGKVDLIRLSSTSDDIIGYVGKVIDEPQNPLLVLLAKTPVNIYAIKWLQIHHR